MKKILSIISVSLILISCSNTESEREAGIKINSFSESGLNLKFNKTPTVGTEVCALIYFKDSSKQIINAYYDCKIDSIKNIDEERHEILECRNYLEVLNDTVVMCITPEINGMTELPNVTILYKDNNISNEKFQIADTIKFSFPVK